MGEKKICPKFRSYMTRARKFLKKSKKIQKIIKLHSGILLYINRVEIGRERKNNFSNSAPTRHGQKNFQKNGKKIQKIKTLHSGIISFQTEVR